MVSFQKGEEFLFERPHAMMFLLPSEIPLDASTAFRKFVG
jgi:hypothetical protein